ncbi:tetratricopeptide repeat protein [Pollutibacter soli]|uniref:tetratricopeptide repeat protein n=1 Tax=Pollutibacter soli TaxID=3034157 RepID=UPI00301395FA
MRKQLLILSAMLFMGATVNAQLFTMSNKCFDRVKNGRKQLDSLKYEEALAIFNEVISKCNSKDAKLEGNLGKARALNGLHKYDEAITCATTAISASKNSNVMAYYTRSYAYQKINRPDDARKDLQRVTELTTKNQNVKARATMFAAMADIDFQEGMKDSAISNLTKAIELDPSNPSFYIQRGDMYIKEGNYADAFVSYDKAVAKGKTDLDMYQIRTNARIKQVQQKYGTDNANTLAQKMTAEEKTMVCAELKKANELGMRNMQLDLFSTMICK